MTHRARRAGSPQTAGGLPAPLYELLEMLTYKRPAGSNAERAFIDRFIRPLGAEEDGFGNLWVEIGFAPILWSSHTDTVHRKSGKQHVMFGDGVASTEGGDCLGADCAAGVWAMSQMIRAGVPGRYVFHRAEEIGGLGSAYVAAHEPLRLEGLDFAIAFDRRGTSDVLTHQAGSRTASDAFARSLCGVLSPMSFQPDTSGVFTDTANYTAHIAECTNISVGYSHAHSPREMLDTTHLTRLCTAVIRADWTRLVRERKPAPSLPFPANEEDWFDYLTPFGASTTPGADAGLERFVYENPSVIAEFLERCGYDEQDLIRFKRALPA